MSTPEQVEHSDDKNKEKEAYKEMAERLIKELVEVSGMLTVSIKRHSHSSP